MLWGNLFMRGEWEYVKFLSVKNTVVQANNLRAQSATSSDPHNARTDLTANTAAVSDAAAVREPAQSMKIYGDTKSGNCLKVKWVCDRLALPYTWVDVDTLKRETRTTQFSSSTARAGADRRA